MKKIRYISLLLVSLLTIQLQNYAQWNQTAGPESGYVTSLTSDDDFIYAGTNGSIHISADNGLTWTRSNSGLTDIGITSLTAGDSIVLAGTVSTRVFRTTDSGQSWHSSSTGLPYSTIRFVAKAESYFYCANYHSLYRSSNKGNDWQPSSFGIGNVELNTFYYTDSLCFTGTSNGVYVSTDFGSNWIERSLGLDNKNIKDFTSTDEYIFVLTESGCFRSSDNGLNWQATGSGLPNLFIFIGKLETVDGNIFAAIGNDRIYISTNSGNNWNLYGNNFPYTITYDLMNKDDILFAGTSCGIYSIDYPNPEWIEMNGTLYASNVYCMLNLDSVIYAGSENGKVYKSTNNGETWSYSFAGSSSNKIIAIAAKGDTLYTSSGWLLYYSTDSGASWQQMNLYSSEISSLVVRGDEIYVSTSFIDGIWVSTDAGQSWQQKNNGLESFSIITLAADELNVYAGTLDGLYISSDSGENWVRAGNGIPQNAAVISSKIIDGYIYAGAIYGLYRSSDYGISWSHKGFANHMVECIDGSGDIVFVGTTTNGIYMSTNNGNTWSQRNSGLQLTWPRSLLFKDNILFTGIYEHSVWKNENLVTGVEDWKEIIPEEFRLYQNYPNPFNPSTKISWHSPVSSWQTIKVFDVLGREVVILVNEYRSAGSYEVEFNTAGLASGVYYYQLMVGSYIEAKKMVLLR